MDKFSFLSNAGAAYVEELYRRYQQDPQQLDASWQRFFEGYEFAGARREGERPDTGDQEVAIMKMINAYRDRGHLVAKTNPIRQRRLHKADLDLEYFGLSEESLNREFDVGQQIRIGRASLAQILAHLKETYCASIGVEFRYIRDSRLRMWLHEYMESRANRPQLSREQKTHVLTKLAQAVGFEKFLSVKYAGQKRFSLEGAESFIPALDALFNEGARWGVREFVMGMAHRGRLNVLANLFGKSYEHVFSEFEGGYLPDSVHGDGDVKYHRGHSADIVSADGLPLHLSLAFNPSHLEAVDPVVQGLVRAKCERLHAGDPTKIVPILVHGDAAISGQGVVYEVLNMSKLDGYGNGGTIHIVVNNQVGFTATAREGRSSLYCTDIAKVTESPVFRVNGDDPEAVCYVAQLAMRLRHHFQIDVFIDLCCYRRNGHNEGDDPRFTQPLLYKEIERHPDAHQIYTERLVAEQVLTPEEAERIPTDFGKLLQDSLLNARKNRPTIQVNFLGRQWSGFREATATDFEQSPETGVPDEVLKRIGEALTTVPKGFHIYPKFQRIFENRRKLLEGGEVDWGLGEAMAFGSLLAENVPVRLSGQDSRRGTFAHRHSVLIDYEDETEYISLNHIQQKQARFQVYNSILSEYAVLGFEYGYSLAVPTGLVLWEAQFGDFVNGAQIIIDQFIASAESKWQRMSGLVLLLPHGYEGQGPEHSSARVSRFLGLCADSNLLVVNATTPANLFHLLRRQVKGPYRKPLICFTPKGLLRHPRARSTLAELAQGCFREVLDDPQVDPARARRVLLCAGKIYYELLEKREREHLDDVAIVRMEQLYPLPLKQWEALANRYATVDDWVWVQEEPVNMGAWDHAARHLKALRPLRVIARPPSASPATGSLKRHLTTQEEILNRAFLHR